MRALLRSISAELVRSSHTVGSRLWVVGLVICVVQTLGWFTVATRGLDSWDQLLGWQTGYVTALAAPLTALIAGLTVRRERAARGGGTDWRPVGAGTIRVARFIVLALQLALFTLVAVGGMLLFGTLVGLAQPPVARVLTVVLVLCIGLLPVLALGLLAAERIGLFGVLPLAVGWQIAGTMAAESAGWWWQPWTWAVRPALPLLRIHGNGIGALPGDPVLAIGVWPPVLLAAALAVLLVAPLALVPPPRERTGGSRAGTAAGGSTAATTASGRLPAPATRGRRRPAAAALVSVRGLWLLPLGVALVVLELAIRGVWNAGYVRGAFGLILLPGWVCLVACLVTRAQEPALRAVLTRSSAHRWCLALAAVLIGGLAPVVLASALLTGVTAFRVAVVAAFIGSALLLVNLWLATRFGIGAALGVSAVGVVMSLIFGGSQLSDGTIWLAGPWAWAYSADNTARMMTVVAVSIPIALLAAVGWMAAVRRAGRLG